VNRSDAPQTAPGAHSLTEDQHRLAYGRTFAVPQGWPLINLASDPPSFGTLVWQDTRADALVAAIQLRYADRTNAADNEPTETETA
jgi:hypothetical protein